MTLPPPPPQRSNTKNKNDIFTAPPPPPPRLFNRWLGRCDFWGTKKIYTVAHKVRILLFYPNLWNYFKNNLKIIDLDNSIHSQILLNNNLTMCVLRDC